ncbi:MAG: OsmC family protein [Lysobacteraceae bacterium]|jgi:uncharacterized OsmC-like protein
MSDIVHISVEQTAGYEFRVRFEEPAIADLKTDLSAPLGQGAGPNPEHLLTAAVANCLSASLMFALSKFRNLPGPLRATATSRTGRNADKRVRVEDIDVRIELPGQPDDYQSLDRVLAQFEAFCTVTESVRQGVSVNISVVDGQGTTLHHSRSGGPQD